MQEQAREDRRRLKFRIASGVLDFFGVLGCTVLIIALLALLISLYGWLRTDLNETFSDMRQNVTDAVLIDK